MLNDYIQKNRVLLEKHMDDFLENKVQQSPSNLPFYTDAFKKIQAFLPKGKLFRGIQVLLAYELCGGTITKKVLDVASAYEILAAMILIHDDIMDNDLLRRGSQSVFSQYIDFGTEKKINNSLLYGQSMGICVGDIGFFTAFELLGQCAPDLKTSQKLIAFLGQEFQILGSAQMTDVYYGSSSYEPTEDEIIDLFKNKTGRYSIIVPLSLGAILAQASDDVLQKINNFGEKLGVIFQIKDDELSLFGDEKTIGKPVGSDIRENKKTLFRSLLMKKSTDKEKESLKNIYGNKNVTPQEITFIKNLIQSYGIANAISKKIETMSEEALVTIDSLPGEDTYKILLKEFVELNLRRVK